MKKYITLILLCLITLVACNKSQLSKSGLKFIKSTYPNIPLENPVLYAQDTVFINDETYTEFIYVDTIKKVKSADLILKYFPEKDSFALYSYAQNWDDGLYRYFLKIKDDTTKFYKKSTITNERFFYIGEYGFERTQNEVLWLTSDDPDPKIKDEIIYYDLHRDSLSKVRGNNLPPLPTPTEEERRIWEEKFGNK